MSIISSLKSLYSHSYNQKFPFRAFNRWFEWNIRRRVSSRPWVWSVWGDQKMWFWPDSSQSMYLAYNWVMDWDEFNFIKRYIKHNDTIIDVGANIGVYTIWMQRFLGNKSLLISFEPEPNTYDRLKSQIRLNEIDCVDTENIALADREGNMKFTTHKDGQNHLVMKDIEESDSVELTSVGVRTLDEYAEERNLGSVNFLKVDIEGAESYFFKGAKSMIRKKKIDVIQSEINSKSKRYNKIRKSEVTMMRKMGYEAFYYDHEDQKIVQNVEKVIHNINNLFFTYDLGLVRDRLI